MGTLAKIRRMYVHDGLPIKEIQRRKGLSRNTIRGCLRKDEMVEPKYPRRPVVTTLAGFIQTLSAWLRSDAHRGKRDRRTVNATYEALAAQGHQGGYGRVAAFVWRWYQKQAGGSSKAFFVPLKLAPGDAFQFEAYARLMRQTGGNPVGVECTNKDRTLWAVVLPNVKSEGSQKDWRVQVFDANGFGSHYCYATVQAAVQDMIARGYHDIDKGALDRCAATPQWSIGVEAQHLRDLHNRGQLGFQEMTERISALHSPARSLN
jgi:hypothetical protein